METQRNQEIILSELVSQRIYPGLKFVGKIMIKNSKHLYGTFVGDLYT